MARKRHNIFESLNLCATDLYKRSKKAKPIPPEELAEIESLISTCREKARTDEQKSIVIRAQSFWDVCFRKWHSQPSEAAASTDASDKNEKSQQAGRFHTVGRFSALHWVTEGLKNEKDVGKKTRDDFDQIIQLIDECKSLAKSSHERVLVRKALDAYEKRLHEWQLIQQRKEYIPKRILSEAEFDAELSEADKAILAAHHRGVIKKLNRNMD